MSIYVSFDLYKDKPIVAAFSTKLGGVSQGDCESMNLSFHRNDNPDHVLQNHEIFAKAVGYEVENCVLSDQVHSTNIRRVTHEDCGKGIFKASDIVNTDGLICDEKDVVLMTFYADCVPLYFYDEAHHAIGLSHSGWRGTNQSMGRCTLEAMNKQFGTQPQDVLAVVGPCICKACYEVSEDVYREFALNHTEDFLHDVFEEKENHKYQLDLKQANRLILLNAGVKPEHIEVCSDCTCCQHDLYFSHRYTNGHRGNLAAVLSLKS